jgi:putative membrane protein
MENTVPEKSLSHSMNTALKHYSSMFFLPSYKKALLFVAAICIGLVGFSTFALLRTLTGLGGSLALGFALFAITIAVDILMSKVIMGVDPIYILRRTLALSLFSWVLWGFFIVIGTFLGVAFGLILWVKLCLLGFGAVLTLRMIVFVATSSTGTFRQILSALLQPFLCIAAFIVFWAGVANLNMLPFLPYLAIAPFAGAVCVFAFLHLLDRLGWRVNGMSSLPLFRAFMLNWVVGLNAPLEKLLEEMGENEDIEVTLLKFDASKPKAAIIVPLVHPGPFKNIGSSLLPSLLKHDFEKHYNCVACTPLGILGHELDLASQAQNHRIINQVIDASAIEATADLASPFVRVKEGSAIASCQIFGKTAFISFTVAPKTTEDLPQELGRIVREEAEKYGLNCSVLVNAHNSLNDIIDTEESLDDLRIAASKCLEQAANLPCKEFMVGAATVFPKEFSLKDGMGTGGITAITVEVEKQKTAYVVIDGNNMVSGFREKILSALSAEGFGESEVFTTDTHAVSALVTGRRGYHPVGEAMNNDVLISRIINAAKSAESKLEKAKAGCLRLTIPQVRVIGKTRIESLSLLIDMALQRAKKTVVPFFALEGLILILLLTFA